MKVIPKPKYLCQLTIMAIMLRPVGFLAPNTLNNLAYQYFD
jgi:hypothetical protein